MKELIIVILIGILVFKWFEAADYKWWMNYYREDSNRQFKFYLRAIEKLQYVSKKLKKYRRR